MGKSVQFQNAPDVVMAYEARNIAAWAIFCDKQFLFKYDGDDVEAGAAELQNILTMLVRNKTSAIYTLCVYDSLGESEVIKSNTPYDGSFNFRLADYLGNVNVPGQYMAVGEAGTREIEKLKKEIETLKSENEKNSLGVVGEILENEQLAPVIGALVGAITDKLLSWIDGKPAAAASGSARRPAGDDDSQVGKLSRVSGAAIDDAAVRQSIQVIANNVDDINAVMQQLARMATNKPLQFKMYVAMLMKMKL